MLAGPLQVPGYYNVSRVENKPIRRLYFPFYVHIWYTGSSGPEPPNLTLLKYHPSGGAGTRDLERYIS